MFGERHLRRELDWALIAAVLALAGISLPMIASATQALSTGNYSSVKRQALSIALGLAVAAIVVSIDYSDLLRFSRVVYILNLGLLASVMVAGRTTLGAQRWIQIGPVPVQPSELAKLCVITTLAAALSRRESETCGWPQIISAFIHIALPMALVLRQPDLGTSLVFMAIAFGMLFAAGAPGRALGFLIVAGLGGITGAIVAHFRWGFPLPLEEYQLKRLIVFTNPGIDPLGSGYQLRQSMIAIGSGRLVGKGLFAGTQNQLRFLPFQHTDFIFSVIGEELGFIGGMAILALYLFVLWRGLRIASMARDSFGALLAVGVVSMLAFHILINIGMTVGMMPVTGIPLPFMSYGGTSLITNMAGIGLLINVYMRRHKIVF
ncbi:MAG: rod shape-determining protein RodA [Ignavibacteriales bacterium]